MEYRFEDFVDPTPGELPEDAPRIDVLEREVNRLRVQVADLESLKSDLRNIEDWFRKDIAQLSVDAAKKFAEQVDSELLVAALEKAGIQQRIQQVGEQAVEIIFRREAQPLYEAVCRAVLKRLGRG